MQAGFGYAGRIKAAFECEPGFLGRVVKRADDEIFTGVSAGPSRQLFIFRGETLGNFRPGNFRAHFGKNCGGAEGDRRDEYPKSFALTGRFAASSPRGRGERRARGIFFSSSP